MSKTQLTLPSTLPVPEKPYASWAKFIRALWEHGMSVHNIDPNLVDEHVELAVEPIREAMTRSNDATVIRPSSFIACARQTYFAATRAPREPMPVNIGRTFAIGHLLHELSYAAMRSAMPVGFKAEVEKEVALPSWWPEDYARFNQNGRVDLLITVEDRDECEKYIESREQLLVPDKMLIDFKTMGGFTYKKHNKTIWGADPDAFGYLAQLAVYTDALGIIDNGAIIAGINRDALTQPLAPRLVPGHVLKEELNRVQVAIEMALDDSDPGEEFLLRHGEEAYFQCGRGGRPGYCAFKTICKANPTRDGNEN